ncbi:hypothetical protein [Pedobacter sp. WC2423]|uniref:hypothetical protein n=1 Tax=Pedobacter sp. WC2423 TaxID=3234142 RepID=UPI003465AF3C
MFGLDRFFFGEKPKNSVYVTDIHDSTVKVQVTNIINTIFRRWFRISDKWLEKLSKRFYDEEIQSKYVPELHLSSQFELRNFVDVLSFEHFIEMFQNQVRVCLEYLSKFEGNLGEFDQALAKYSITVINPKNQYIKGISQLKTGIPSYRQLLERLQNQLGQPGFGILSQKNLNNGLGKDFISLSYRVESWKEFLSKDFIDSHLLRYLINNYNLFYRNIGELNAMLISMMTSSNHKIISGNAGMGKTHLSAHLYNGLKRKGDYALFFKASVFNGDDVDLEHRLLRLLEVPQGYGFEEVLRKLDGFARSRGRRMFFIFDALNETTKSTIGFSDIWKQHLPRLLTMLEDYPNLYVICTLRTSYIDQIWKPVPRQILELSGFVDQEDVYDACKRYFRYYKIEVLNIDTADLSYFSVPLLLDLFCKMINEKRLKVVQVTLDIKSYLEIFERYIASLTFEVKEKMKLAMATAITDGFSASSKLFMDKTEAVVPVDDFAAAFDKSSIIKRDESIAIAVLEGYLVYIKDIGARRAEVVRHTQQEVGGYLIAKELISQTGSLADLIASDFFLRRIIGSNTADHHQLRLDILKFLIAMQPEVITALESEDAITLAWWYLYNGYDTSTNPQVAEYLVKKAREIDTNAMFETTYRKWQSSYTSLDFSFVRKALSDMDQWTLDITWGRFLFQHAGYFQRLVDDNIGDLREDKFIDQIRHHNMATVIAFILSTTVTDLRDIASVYLIEYGKRFPLELLQLTQDCSKVSDSYIYQRLVCCCYGVALINQHDKVYVSEYLPIIAKTFYQLQFAPEPASPRYNYIVIDSVKHLLDLASLKKAFEVPDSEKKRISLYQFSTFSSWLEPSDAQRQSVDRSRETDWPAPIGMDFGIYTIPRLIDRETISQREAIANVLKRVYELGYQEIQEFRGENFNDFYWGNLSFNSMKAERLGKKYSWIAFFDYAGYLLLNQKIRRPQYDGDNDHIYDRLSDVNIDPSMPSKKYKEAIRLYDGDLMGDRASSEKWSENEKMDVMPPLFQQIFSSQPHTMLYGKVEGRINEEYKVRSFLLTESFFVKRTPELDLVKANHHNFREWKNDIHVHRDYLRHVYFGELFWADNIPETEMETISIPTGKTITRKFKFEPGDMLREFGSRYHQIGEEFEQTGQETIAFQSETTQSEYLWETDSEYFHGFSEYFPSIKMAKRFNLKSVPQTGQIVDEDLKECYKCIDFKDLLYSNQFNYIRNDLLKTYMKENDLSMVYQVKQHSYDESSGARHMKFYVLNIEDIN